MHDVVDSLRLLFTSLGDLVVALGALLLPFLPLLAWIAFWLFAVNWVKLRSVLLSGGWIGLALVGLVAILVWGTVAPPPSGMHYFLGLSLSNYVGKTVLVTTLVCIMFLCGSVQLSGACGLLCQFDEPGQFDEPVQFDESGHDGGHAPHSPAHGDLEAHH